MRIFDLGEKLHCVTEEFDGRTVTLCEVVEKHEDHYIAKELNSDHPATLWIDEDTDYMFERI